MGNSPNTYKNKLAVIESKNYGQIKHLKDQGKATTETPSKNQIITETKNNTNIANINNNQQISNTKTKASSQLTKENWKNHPYYHSSSANKFEKIHDHFRAEFKIINDLCLENKLKDAHKRYTNLYNLLDRHHYVEEEKLFPYLRDVLKLQLEEKKLQQDHDTMNIYLNKLTTTFNSSRKNRYENFQKELSELTKQFMDHMMQHLLDEGKTLFFNII
jgi:hypothetical protein